MKTYKHILSAVLATTLVTLTSCGLDYEPISDPSEITEGALTDTTSLVLKDKDAATGQLNKLYKLMQSRQEHLYVDNRLIGDSHTDNAYGGTTGNEVTPIESNTLDASYTILQRDWSRYLEDIAQSNQLIIGSEQLFKKGDITEAEYHSYKAQGEVFRALMMFRMARLWGGFPMITTIAKTITYENINEIYPLYYPARTPVEDCYKQIVKDLEDAEQYAPAISNADRTVFSKTAAQALLAKVYAEKPIQNYDKVIEYAEKVRKTEGVALEPDYATLFGYNDAKRDCAKRNTTEGILEVQFLPGSGNWETWMYGKQLDNPEQSWSWAKWITPSRDIIKDFENEHDNIRMNQSIVYYATTGWSNYYPASHYPFMYKVRSGMSNEYVLRLADIMLLEAEAYAYKGELDKAADIVDIIRERVKLQPLTADKKSSKDAMIEAVLHERRLELAFEGERWFDLCRNGKVEQYLNNLNSRDSGRLPLLRKYSQELYLMPIPQTAIDKNENLKQNPGY